MKTPSRNIEKKLLELLRQFGEVHVDEPMANHTTYKTGGTADCLFVPDDIARLGELRDAAQHANLPFLVIGGGSNLLVSDRGIRGIVCQLSGTGEEGIRVMDDANPMLYADARVDKKAFLDFALRKGYSGMEFMAGLPGCIGGGIAMNAGTNMGWFSDVLARVRIIEKDGVIREKNLSDDMISYRGLKFEEGTIILGGYFSLKKAEHPKEVRELVDAIIQDRESKHPLEYPSAGSVFKNPEGHSSWKLINDAGLRGFAIGGAMVSEKHTNFIINTGGATASDIYRLIRHVQEVVEKKFGVRLEPEVRMLGEFC